MCGNAPKTKRPLCWHSIIDINYILQQTPIYTSITSSTTRSELIQRSCRLSWYITRLAYELYQIMSSLVRDWTEMNTTACKDKSFCGLMLSLNELLLFWKAYKKYTSLWYSNLSVIKCLTRILWLTELWTVIDHLCNFIVI